MRNTSPFEKRAGLEDSLWILPPVLLPQPIFTERSQPGKRFPILLPIGRRFTRDDVVDMADGETFDLDAPPPGVLETFNTVGSEHQVEVERSVLQLHEVLAAFDLSAAC